MWLDLQKNELNSAIQIFQHKVKYIGYITAYFEKNCKTLCSWWKNEPIVKTWVSTYLHKQEELKSLCLNGFDGRANSTGEIPVMLRHKPVLKPGWIIWVSWVTFCPGHPSLTYFKIYWGLTMIGSCESWNETEAQWWVLYCNIHFSWAMPTFCNDICWLQEHKEPHPLFCMHMYAKITV